MGFLKFLRGKLTALPEEIKNGSMYVTQGDQGLYADMGGKRYRLNAPANWDEQTKGSPSYIENKPKLGTVAGYDIAEELNQQETIPTSKQVYNAIRDVRAEMANAIKVETPYVARGVSDMVDHSRPYVYLGDESGMNTGHWYWSDGTSWNDGGVYNATAIDTDTTLMKSGKPADAAATGNFINEIKGDTDDIYIKLNKLISEVGELSVRADSFFDGLEVTDAGLVWGIQGNQRLNGPYGPFAGNGSGGGGGGSSVSIDAVFSADNNTAWTSNILVDGDDLLFTFTWSSLENDEPNGRGTVSITVNNVPKGTISVPQGDNVINLKQYYDVGANRIMITIADQYDQQKRWIVNFEVVQLVITSTFSTATPFTDTITVPYTAVGNVPKTVYFVLDGQVVGTNVVQQSGRTLNYPLPQQSHGSHTLDIYFEADVQNNGQLVRSNTLHYEFICIREGSTEVIVVSSFNTFNQKQYASVVIPYQVYDPVNLNPEVEFYENDVLIATQKYDPTQPYFTYKANKPGEMTIKIVSGNSQPKIIPLVIEESDVHIEAETEGLELYLTTSGRSNTDTNKNVWEYNGIQAEMTNFGWKSIDGWINDSEGNTVLRTLGDARVYIPFKPFANNFTANGKTIEIEFSTNSVVDYSSTIISCMYNNRGFEITPQTITFKSSQTELMTPFKDNEHIRATIVVHSQSNNQLILFYINGVMSSAIRYPDSDTFTQGRNAVGITIGSNTCGVDIYNIRIYNQDLTREQVINNWIADTQQGDLMMERYQRNNIFDNGIIKTSSLPSNMPYWILNAPELPQYKGDKKTITLSFTDPLNPDKSFSAEGVKINVQGTSSQAYYRKNYDLQFEKGFNMTKSGYAENYVISDALPFNRFVLKADVASSESTNNTRLTMYYNELCPYKVPEMLQNPKVRWGIEGRPCVVFWYNPDTRTTEFLGKFNMNLPKRCPEPLGYSGMDESWEVERNNSANVQFQDNDFESKIWDSDANDWKLAWYDDWEARFPNDTHRDNKKLNEFVSWVLSTWRNQKTNEPLENEVTFTVDTTATISQYPDDDSYSYTTEEVTTTDSEGKTHTTTQYKIKFTKDTEAYRLTKFRAEAPKYMEIESATFYYLFTHFFLMIDSRAKNMFFGFHGSDIDQLEYITRKTVFEPYDMDTGLGTNNSGVLKFGYYHLDTDTVSNIISGGGDGDGLYHLHYIYSQDTTKEVDFSIDPEWMDYVNDEEIYPDGVQVESDNLLYIMTFTKDGACVFQDKAGSLTADTCTYTYADGVLTITTTSTGREYSLKLSGSKNAPVFNAQNSVLWVNFRDAFRTEYANMYKELRATEIFNYDYVENMYEQHQSMWPEALFNEDSYVKYIVPLVENVTYDEDLKQYIKTDRYLTMLQGSKEQQRKWWLQNRFRYFDSMFTVGSANTSFIEMRLFNSGTLHVTPSQDLYVAVRFGRGSTTQRVRAVAGQTVDFEYVFNSNIDLTDEQAVITEMESTIFSANLISDVGDLSGFLGNEFDFSRATRLRRLKLGDASPTYNNANLTKLNVNNCYLLEEIDCRNCSELAQEISLDNSTMLERAYFDNTKIPSISFVPGAPLTHVHLPTTINMLVLVDHTDLEEFTCADYSKIDTLMLENIKQKIVDPIEVVKLIDPEARINIQGFYVDIVPEEGDKTVQIPIYDENDDTEIVGYEEKTLTTDAEKAGYEIEQFFEIMKHMKGVTRTRKRDDKGNLLPGWDYHDAEKPIISGTFHTKQLTGTQKLNYQQQYPYITFKADKVESKRYYMSQDGETVIAGPFVVVDGKLQSGQNIPSTVTINEANVWNYNSAKYTYTFAGWNTEKEKEVTNVNHYDENKDKFEADHSFFAVFTKVINKFTVTWKNEDGTTLTGFTNPQTYEYGQAPVYPGSSMPTKQVNGVTVPATAWTPSISMVTQNTTYTAVYKPVYTATFVNTNGASLYSHQFIEDETPVYAGSINPPQHPDHEEGADDFEFLGWSPALGPIKANTTYTAVYQDKRSLTVQYLTGALTSYETASTGAIREYAFYNMTSLEKVDLTSTSAITINANAFYGCTNLDSLIVRSTTMSTLSATSALTSTKIASYDGVVYVNSSVLSSYTSNNTWKQYLITTTADYPASSTKLFELYDAKFSTTTDSWEDIASNGNYATDYTVGTTKKVVDGGTFGPIIMQLVAMGQDVKADGSGDKARMTWISQDLIDKHVMNANGTTTRTGKYGNGEGGWAGSEMREWLIDDVLPQINFHASSDAFAPVPVTKTQSIYANNAIQIDGQTTTDSIWIPSDHEIFGTTSYESNEVATYTGWFNSNSRRKKNYNGSAYVWWLRSAYSTGSYRCVSGSGSTSGNYAYYAYGVALGFCL